MISYSFVGIDVAKEKFDACLVKATGGIEKVFTNTASGFKEFIRWLKKHGDNFWICMESTGFYSEILADFLFSEGLRVSVVNPVQIKYFAKVRLSRNKNDKVDARIIADYCQTMSPRLFKPRSSQQKYLRELIQLDQTLRSQRTQLSLQCESAQTKEIKKEFKKIIKALDKRIEAIFERIRSKIKEDVEWGEIVKRLIEIKGLGELSIYRLLAYLPDISLFKTAKQLAAFIGVSPRQRESGKYAGQTRLSKFGNPHLRRILYMPALSAKHHNEALQPFVIRLQNNGLTPMAIVGAVMRKLVHIIFGMLKNKATFNPDLV